MVYTCNKYIYNMIVAGILSLWLQTGCGENNDKYDK